MPTESPASSRSPFASKRLIALVFGPGDYAAYADMPVLSIGAHDFAYPGHIYHFALQRIVTAAKAAGLQTIDGPFGKFRDLEGLRNSAQMAKMLGCDGKWAVHPAQIPVLNEVFSPSAAEIAKATAIRDRYFQATEEEGTGRSGARRRGDAGRGEPQAGRGGPAAGRG